MAFNAFVESARVSMHKSVIEKKEIVVFGIDPGTVHLGWAILRDGAYHTSGTLIPKKMLSNLDRQLWLLSKLQDLIKEFHPSILSFEEFMWRSSDDGQMRYVTGRPAMERLIGGIQTLSLYPPYPVLVPLLPAKWGQQLFGQTKHTKYDIACAVNMRLKTTFKGDVLDNHASDATGIALVAFDMMQYQSYVNHHEVEKKHGI